MDPSHPQWDEFIERLSGPEGCNFREDSNGKLTWSWKGGELARAILAHYDVDVEVSLPILQGTRRLLRLRDHSECRRGGV